MDVAQWRHQLRYFECLPSATLKEWLTDPGSLTRRMQTTTRKIRVVVLQQNWRKPTRSEQRALGLRRGELANIREVIMMADDEPWIFARSVIPRSTAVGAAKRLLQPDARPLGYFLFADRSITRSDFEYSYTDLSPFTELHAALKTPHCCWGRRSQFYIKQQPLLLTEWFLPAIEAYLC